MDCNKYLEKFQPITYRIFYSALKQNKLFHAYLFSGETGSPLLEVSKYLAKSILCDHPNPFACENCESCKRVDDDNFQDLIVIDGKKEEISKEAIEHIEDVFSRSSINGKGIKIYIINLVENMNEKSVNALLKFLEEPTENTYAFLTTENEFSVLPTILSRTQIIHLNQIDKHELINETIDLGTQKIDAEILSSLYNDAETILEQSKTQEFLIAKEEILSLFNNLENKKKLRFFIESEICSRISRKQDVRYFIDILLFILKEAYLYSIKKETLYDNLIPYFEKLISNLKDMKSKILLLMEARNELNYNLIASLLLLHMLTNLFEV